MLTIQSMPIEQIIPYARNPRQNEQAVSKVAASLKEFGWQQPIVLDAEKVIIAGHTRWLAAKQLGMTSVPVCIAVNLTSEQVKAYRLADNRTHEESTWDNDLLAFELADLSALNVDLGLTGFNPDEMQSLMALADAVKEGFCEEEACPLVPDSPVTRLGDSWQLGRHTLLCGDATRLDQVEQLMAGECADMVFTDPPYNVNYQGYTPDQLTLMQDKMDGKAFLQFLRDTFASYRIAVKPTASLYICHSSLYQREFQTALEDNGFVVRHQIIWAKNHFAWGYGRYKFQHEPIFYCYSEGQSDPWYGDNSQSTLWQVDKPSANRLHPTMKPIPLIESALQNSSQAGDRILDLFGGSGSTLIAAEKMGRRACLMELDPKYCDVIVQRFQDFTHQKAILRGTSLTFEEAAAAAHPLPADLSG